MPKIWLPLLPASDEEIKALRENNDVSSMSSREIQKAIQNARKEGREEAEQEQAEKTREALKCMADDKASALAKQKMAFDEEMRKQSSASAEAMDALRAELNESLAAAESLRAQVEEAESRAKDATQAAIDAGKDVSAQSNRLEAEARRLRQELEDRDAEIEDMQRKYDAMRDDLIAAQQIVARGDAERTNADILSAEALCDDVQSFISRNGRLPFMHGTFATMDALTRDNYRAPVLQLQDWCRKCLDAMDAVDGNGGTVE